MAARRVTRENVMMKGPTVIPLGGYRVGVYGEAGEMAGTLMYMHARDETRRDETRRDAVSGRDGAPGGLLVRHQTESSTQSLYFEEKRAAAAINRHHFTPHHHCSSKYSQHPRRK